MPVKHQEEAIVFQVEGDASILGVDNGGRKVLEKYQSNKVQTVKGKALPIIQATKITSELQITATSNTIEREILGVK